jgi:putative transcriptional regulator
MKKKTSLGQRIIEGLEEFARVLESGEPLEKHFTIRRVALPPVPALTAEEAKQVRRLLGASQAVFARFLGVSPQTVRAWEQGVNAPSAMACRFLEEIRLNPPYWKERLRAVAVTK